MQQVNYVRQEVPRKPDGSWSESAREATEPWAKPRKPESKPPEEQDEATDELDKPADERGDDECTTCPFQILILLFKMLF